MNDMTETDARDELNWIKFCALITALMGTTFVLGAYVGSCSKDNQFERGRKHGHAEAKAILRIHNNPGVSVTEIHSGLTPTESSNLWWQVKQLEKEERP